MGIFDVYMRYQLQQYVFTLYMERFPFQNAIIMMIIIIMIVIQIITIKT